MVMFGGVGMQPQIDKLRRGVDILVATPGRLLDHHGQRTLDLSHVEIFVLDEADRMLDMGFIHDIKKVLAVLPAKKQSLLFSATFSDEIKALADKLLNKPALIEVARRNQTADNDRAEDAPGVARAQEGTAGAPDPAGRLAPGAGVHAHETRRQPADRFLNEQGISAMAIHGNKSQTARTKALADFKAGKLQVLVATDIAARGIDIDQLPHVVNFDLPNVPEDYVHRIGRTGRAGATGEAMSLVCVDEDIFLRDIERLTKHTIPREVVSGFEPDPSERAEPIVLGRMTIGIGGTSATAVAAVAAVPQAIEQAQAAALTGAAARLRVAPRRRRPGRSAPRNGPGGYGSSGVAAAEAATAGSRSRGQGQRLSVGRRHWLIGRELSRLLLAQSPVPTLINWCAASRPMPTQGPAGASSTLTRCRNCRRPGGHCCLGTTIKQAGSQAAFRAVDFDAVLAFATAARAAGAKHFAVVSALGANPSSTVFYNRVKGEMEACRGPRRLRFGGHRAAVVAEWRPRALGQSQRGGERIALWLSAPIRGLIPKGLRPIKAHTVALGMWRALQQQRPGVRVARIGRTSGPGALTVGLRIAPTPSRNSLQDLGPQLGEHLAHLGQHVVAVGAFECVHAGAVPARGAVVDARDGGMGFDAHVEIGVEEQRKRQAIAPAVVERHTMRRASGTARRSCGRACRRCCTRRSSASGGASIQPSRVLHLQAADIVLPQQREQAVVGVLTNAPAHIQPAGTARRVLEDAKQHQRVGRVAARRSNRPAARG